MGTARWDATDAEGLRLAPAHGVALERDGVGAVQQAVHDGVRDRGLAQPLMPGGGGQLAGDEGAAAARTIVEQFQQVVRMRSIDYVLVPAAVMVHSFGGGSIRRRSS
jgi:hypothetical protein